MIMKTIFNHICFLEAGFDLVSLNLHHFCCRVEREGRDVSHSVTSKSHLILCHEQPTTW